MVPRLGRWERPLLGTRASDQETDAARVYGAAVHVLSGSLQRAVPLERGRWRNADQVPAFGGWSHFRGPPRWSFEGLGVHPRVRAEEGRSGSVALSKSAVSATAGKGETLCVQRAWRVRH